MENRNEVQYAGFFTRLLATLVDIVVVLFLVYIIDLVIDNKSIQNIFFMFAIWWIYTSVMLMKWRATIGGKIFGIEILSTSLDPLSFKWVSLRFLVSVIPFLLYLYVRNMQYGMIPSPSPTVQQLPQLLFFLPPLVMFLMKKKQMVHDLLVQSIVIDVSKKKHMDKVSQGNIVYFGQKVLRIGGTLIFLVVVGYLLVYVSVFYSLSKSSHDAYNTSFHKQYSTNDYNDSKIIFYNSELEKNSQKFVDAEGMYDIFEADVKKDLALNCIQYFLKKHNETNWIDAGSGFRKNARNKYADTEEKINKAKKNEDYTGRHFYTFDLNMVNHIEDDLTKIWSDKNDSVCEQQLSVNYIYEVFIEKYIPIFEVENIQSQFGDKPQQREVDWYNLLMKKHPEYLEKKKKEEIVLNIEYKKIQKQEVLEKKEQNTQRNTIYEQDVNRGVPPIFAAIQNHLDKKLSEILDSGADIEIKNKFGATPLIFSLYQHDDKLVKILLEYGANPNLINGDGLYSPLSEVCVTNRLSTAKLLLEHGADVNYQYKKSETALTVAVKECKNFEMVKLLLDNGADPKLIDRFGTNTLTGLKRYCQDDTAYIEMKNFIQRNSL